MKWLFLLLLFDTSVGGMKPKLQVTAVFASEDECNRLGREMAEKFRYEDNSLRSFSICIPESAYEETEMQVEQLD